MKKILFLGYLLALIANMMVAQKPVVKISPEFKLPKSKVFQNHIFTDSEGAHYLYYYEYGASGILVRTAVVENMILEKYDANFRLVYAKEFKSDRKDVSTLGLKYFQGKFAWLFSEENKKGDYIRYGIVPIGLDGKQEKPIDIAKIKYESRSDIPAVRWSVSKDSSKMLIRAINDDNDDEKTLGVFVSVLDQTYAPVWSKKVSMRYTEEQVSIISSHIQNDGTVYLLSKVYEGKKAKESKKEKKKSVAAYDIVLFQITKDSEAPKEIKLNIGSSFVRGASLAADPSGSLNCAGFFSNTKSGSIQGVFFLKLSPDGTVLASSKKEFSSTDLKTIGKDNTDKDKEGDEGLEDSFAFSDFLVKDDGSAVVIAEENYTRSFMYYNSASKTWDTRITYYSQDIVFFTIASDGAIERVTIIPKNQAGASDYFQSYVAMVKNKDVFFFYNEDEDNMKKPVNNPKPKPVGSFKESVAVMTTLNEAGALSRKQLFEAKDAESLFVPQHSRQISQNQLFFISQRFKLFGKTNFHIGTVTVP